MRNLRSELAARQAQGLARRRRVIVGKPGVRVHVDGQVLLAFCSNDYLGLAQHPKLVQALRDAAVAYGVGSGASHLVTGHHQVHEQTEQQLAEWTQRDRALLFTSGYMANTGVVTALLKRGDVLLEDRLNHASLLDAGRLSGARLHRYAHNDVGAAESRLADGKAKEIMLATDAVFSMDGDLAPLPALADLAKRFDAWLLVDDAHGLGVLGPNGRGSLGHFGLSQDQVPILMGTLGKAFGCFGAFVAGSATLIEYLIQHARSYIYTTAPPPALAGAIQMALAIVHTETWRRDRLATLIQRFRVGAKQLGLPIPESITPIQPLLLGDSQLAVAVSAALEARGILVTPIRPPTVPANSARLRITFSAAHSEADVDRLLSALEEEVVPLC